MKSRCIAVAALGAALAGDGARAAVFVVNSLTPTDANCEALIRETVTGDGSGLGACSLPAAVAAANLRPGADEIVISRVGEFDVTVQSLSITDDLFLNAAPIAGLIGQFQPTRVTLVVNNGLVVADTVDSAVLQNMVLAGGDVQVGNAVLTFLQTTGTSTFAENLSGAGGLEKDGDGTLVLTGTNTYTGGTLISQGTLQGDTLSIFGGTEVLVQHPVIDNAKLVFDQELSDPMDFWGPISGTGSLEKTGEGALFLHIENSYTGGTTISEGTLIGFVGLLGDPTLRSLPGDIVNNGELVMLVIEPGTFPDDISGSGNVVKIGVGPLTLTGTNSFRGGLAIFEGNVIGSTRSIPGNVLIDSASNLEFLQENADGSPLDGTHAGNLSSDTSVNGIPSDTDTVYTVTKNGPGTLTLTGTNTYLGGTLVRQGTLAGTTNSLQRTIDLNGAGTSLVFSQGFDGSFAGAIRGAGALAKSGAGAVTFTQSQPAFAPSSATTITGGRLVIGDTSVGGSGTGTTLPGDVVVASGGTLSGIGSVGGAVSVDGTVAPQGSAPGLRVGSVSFNPGSALSVVADGAGFADLLAVTGGATLSPGAALRFDLENVDRNTPFSAPVLTAGSPINDPLFSTTQTSAFFDVSVTGQGTNTLELSLAPNGSKLFDFAQSESQEAVGRAIENALELDPSPDLEEVEDEFAELPAEEIPEILDAMSGEQLTQFATARLAIGDRMQASVQRRIRNVAWGDGETLLAAQGPAGAAPVFAGNPLLARALPGFAQGSAWPTLAGGQSMSSVLDSATSFRPAQGEHGLGGWIDGYGIFGKLDGDSGGADLDYTVGGVTLGLDQFFAQRWLVGLAGGYAYSDLSFDGQGGSQSAHTGHGALYAGTVWPWLQLGASGRFGYSAMDSTREIDFMDRDADADFDGWDAGARAEAALDLWKLGPVELQPLAMLQYAHVQQDAFDESGADSLDLDVDEQEIDSFVSGLGARFHGVFQIDEELYFHPELRASWLHEFADEERELDAVIAGTPAGAFTVRGSEVPADTGVFGVSWTVVATQRLHVFADYDVTLGSSLLQHGASAGLKIVW